ncbi:UNVERIFIED_CONTAM: hypothetical protein GTU68_023988 [Idotea baltica]|nr:hypothetical protein [Idotea baltica]
MMYYKAKLFDDFEMMEKIMETTSPARVKKLGRKVKGFDEEIWRKNRRKIVEKVLLHKFKQNKDILVKLLSTKGSKLYEASPYDKIWGIGLVESNARLMDKSRWPGENLLGELLMKVRSKLIRSRK